jgi:predicted RNA-binding Zn ribbon-like protein
VIPDPGGREPAPEPLRAIQLFVNTRDIERRQDELSSPAALAAVLEQAGLGDGLRPTAADLRRALEVREALRALLLAGNGIAPAPGELEPLERAARAGRLSARFTPAAELVAEAGGVAGALGRLIAIVVAATADGSLSRLKACRRDVCHWVYYDRSRNHGSTWCSMAVCGNRTKVRGYRSRQKSPVKPSSSRIA